MSQMHPTPNTSAGAQTMRGELQGIADLIVARRQAEQAPELVFSRVASTSTYTPSCDLCGGGKGGQNLRGTVCGCATPWPGVV